ncbi:MAG: response regulator [Leptolinea sp.]|jgi:DNA-binding response OmpR family regulator|nr:response regulator [Leptolinea sp.]
MRIPRILVIDDDPTIARIVRLTLHSKGYDVVVAEDTHQGLKDLFQETTDLILLDYMLPEQNGLAFLKDIRAEPELSHIPVIMLTTTGLSEVVQAARLLGANDFLTKPFDLNTLIERVSRLAPFPEAPEAPTEESQA